MNQYPPHQRAPRRGLDWTSEDDYKLWKLIESGTSHREIAIALGRTVATIGPRIARLRRQRRQEVA